MLRSFFRSSTADGLKMWGFSGLMYVLFESSFLASKESLPQAALIVSAYFGGALICGLLTRLGTISIAAAWNKAEPDRINLLIFLFFTANIITNTNLQYTVLNIYLSGGYRDNLYLAAIWLAVALFCYWISGRVENHKRRFFFLAAATGLVLLLLLLQADSRYFDLIAPGNSNGWYVAITVSAAVIYSFLFYGISTYLAGSEKLTPRLPVWSRTTFLPAFILVAGFIFIPRMASGPVSRSVSSVSGTVSARPSIILIILDTARASHLRAYGYPRNTMPKLESLSPVTLYRSAWTTSSWTVPAHASIFTGLFSGRHGINHQVQSGPGLIFLDNRLSTLAELLGRVGYNTAGFVTNFYLFSGNGFEQGFRHYYDAPSRGIQERLLFNIGRTLLPVGWMDPPSNHNLYRRAGDLNRTVFDWLDRNPQHPFFLFVNYMDAHWPYLPPSPCNTLFAGYDHESAAELASLDLSFLELGGMKLSPRMQNHIISQYDGELSYLDSELDGLISKLKKKNLFDNSLIIITSDHGESLGDHAYLTHGRLLYEGLTRIPLFVKYPLQDKSTVDYRPVQLLDLFPTILKAAELKAPAGTQGQLLDEVSHEIIMEAYQERPAAENRQSEWRRAIIAEGYKLIVEGDGNHELYKLDTDTGETDNLVNMDAEFAGRLAARLEACTGMLSPLYKDLKALRNSRTELERLKSLGYVK